MGRKKAKKSASKKRDAAKKNGKANLVTQPKRFSLTENEALRARNAALRVQLASERLEAAREQMNMALGEQHKTTKALYKVHGVTDIETRYSMNLEERVATLVEQPQEEGA